MNSTTISQQRRRKLQQLEETNDNLQQRVDVLLRRTSQHYKRPEAQAAPARKKHSVPPASLLPRTLSTSLDGSLSAGTSSAPAPVRVCTGNARGPVVSDLVGRFDQTAAQFNAIAKESDKDLSASRRIRAQSLASPPRQTTPALSRSPKFAASASIVEETTVDSVALDTERMKTLKSSVVSNVVVAVTSVKESVTTKILETVKEMSVTSATAESLETVKQISATSATAESIGTIQEISATSATAETLETVKAHVDDPLETASLPASQTTIAIRKRSSSLSADSIREVGSAESIIVDKHQSVTDPTEKDDVEDPAAHSPIPEKSLLSKLGHSSMPEVNSEYPSPKTIPRPKSADSTAIKVSSRKSCKNIENESTAPKMLFLFTLVPPHDARSVFLTGSFDDWSKSIEMHQSNSGNWTAQVLLDPARTYEYKFVVDGIWIADSSRTRKCDEMGNINNFLKVDSTEGCIGVSNACIVQKIALSDHSLNPEEEHKHQRYQFVENDGSSSDSSVDGDNQECKDLIDAKEDKEAATDDKLDEAATDDKLDEAGSQDDVALTRKTIDSSAEEEVALDDALQIDQCELTPITTAIDLELSDIPEQLDDEAIYAFRKSGLVRSTSVFDLVHRPVTSGNRILKQKSADFTNSMRKSVSWKDQQLKTYKKLKKQPSWLLEHGKDSLLVTEEIVESDEEEESFGDEWKVWRKDDADEETISELVESHSTSSEKDVSTAKVSRRTSSLINETVHTQKTVTSRTVSSSVSLSTNSHAKSKSEIVIPTRTESKPEKKIIEEKPLENALPTSESSAAGFLNSLFSSFSVSKDKDTSSNGALIEKTEEELSDTTTVSSLDKKCKSGLRVQTEETAKIVDSESSAEYASFSVNQIVNEYAAMNTPTDAVSGKPILEAPEATEECGIDADDLHDQMMNYVSSAMTEREVEETSDELSDSPEAAIGNTFVSSMDRFSFRVSESESNATTLRSLEEASSISMKEVGSTLTWNGVDEISHELSDSSEASIGNTFVSSMDRFSFQTLDNEATTSASGAFVEETSISTEETEDQLLELTAASFSQKMSIIAYSELSEEIRLGIKDFKNAESDMAESCAIEVADDGLKGVDDQKSEKGQACAKDEDCSEYKIVESGCDVESSGSNATLEIQDPSLSFSSTEDLLDISQELENDDAANEEMHKTIVDTIIAANTSNGGTLEPAKEETVGIVQPLSKEEIIVQTVSGSAFEAASEATHKTLPVRDSSTQPSQKNSSSASFLSDIFTVQKLETSTTTSETVVFSKTISSNCEISESKIVDAVGVTETIGSKRELPKASNTSAHSVESSGFMSDIFSIITERSEGRKTASEESSFTMAETLRESAPTSPLNSVPQTENSADKTDSSTVVTVKTEEAIAVTKEHYIATKTDLDVSEVVAGPPTASVKSPSPALRLVEEEIDLRINDDLAARSGVKKSGDKSTIMDTKKLMQFLKKVSKALLTNLQIAARVGIDDREVLVARFRELKFDMVVRRIKDVSTIIVILQFSIWVLALLGRLVL
ncbi:MAG: hypothetical protein SGCHY_001616 [Lobulomycetales sp.]